MGTPVFITINSASPETTAKLALSYYGRLHFFQPNKTPSDTPEVTPKEDIAYRFWEAVAAITGFGEPQALKKQSLRKP